MAAEDMDEDDAQDDFESGDGPEPGDEEDGDDVATRP